MTQTLIFILSVLLWLYPSDTQQQHQRVDTSEYNCLVTTLWHESRNQSTVGIAWTAAVIINRTKHGNYPDTVCKVVLQRSQFSNVQEAFKRDISLVDSKGYVKVSSVAYSSLYGDLSLPKQPLFYHTKSVKPIWRHKLKKLHVIGAHVFYGEDNK